MSGIEKGHSSSIKGFNNEIKVLNLLEKYSISEKLGLKIFHEVPLQHEKLLALCDVFRTNCQINTEGVLISFFISL